jgi:tetratricopeptide (TPR) repeat protein
VERDSLEHRSKDILVFGVSFLSRLLSSDYRRALAAEAAGDYSLAARLYAQCGETRKVAEMHLLQIGPKTQRDEALSRLREAARWAADDQTLLRKAALGIEREGRRDAPTAPPDGELLHEAAELYERAGAFRQAALCLEAAGDAAQAAELWGRAGDLGRMESLLDRERAGERAGEELHEAWEEYGLEMAAGRREKAREAIERCCSSPAAGAERPEYLRLREELDGRRLQGFVALRRNFAYAGAFPIVLGREGSSGLALRDGSVSRLHARIDFADGKFVLSDFGSRNGTRLDGIAIGDAIVLGERGEIGLGDDCGIEFVVRGERLELAVTRGREKGWRLHAQLAPFELAAGVVLRFENGRPIVRSERGPFRLGGQMASSEIECIRGDVISLDGTTWEVA